MRQKVLRGRDFYLKLLSGKTKRGKQEVKKGKKHGWKNRE